MRECPECGNSSPDQAMNCAECNYAFPPVFLGSNAPRYRKGRDRSVTMVKRPTGTGFIRTGLWLIAIGIITILIWALRGIVGDPSEIGAIFSLFLAALASAILPLGLMLFSLGQVQRSIWFLPGNDTKNE